MSDIVRFVLFDVLRYRERIIKMNLKNSFPEKSENELNQIIKSFQKHFCDVYIETIKMLTLPEDEVKARIDFKNIDLMVKYLREDRNILLYSSHVGNWEWLITMPLHFEGPSATFYQKLSSNYFNELMVTIRNRFGVHCIESKFAYRELIKYKRDAVPFVTCMIGDQGPKRNSTVHWTNFMNQDTAFFTGAAKIANKFNFVILYPKYQKTSRGRYEVSFQLLSDNPKSLSEEQIIEKFSTALEDQLKSAPEMWLWSHKRWKRKPKDFVVMQQTTE